MFIWHSYTNCLIALKVDCSLKSERVVLLSKLRPEVIVHENPYELSKYLSKQFAGRLP